MTDFKLNKCIDNDKCWVITTVEDEDGEYQSQLLYASPRGGDHIVSEISAVIFESVVECISNGNINKYVEDEDITNAYAVKIDDVTTYASSIIVSARLDCDYGFMNIDFAITNDELLCKVPVDGINPYVRISFDKYDANNTVNDICQYVVALLILRRIMVDGNYMQVTNIVNNIVKDGAISWLRGS